jgi:hypothetical protein
MNTVMLAAPDRSEAAEYYFRYIDLAAGSDVLALLERQTSQMLELLASVDEARSLHRYAPDKWSMRQVLSHVSDTERVFVYRALWFARGFEAPLPGFDQDVAVAGADANARTWRSHLDEFQSVRAATVTFFRGLQPDAWDRRGVASDNPVTVRALAFITAGHVAHHINVLRERYL